MTSQTSGANSNPSRRVRDPHATKEKLRGAAIQLLISHGYSRASVDRILEAANLSKGAFFHHYANKHLLFVDALEELSWNQVGKVLKAAHKLQYSQYDFRDFVMSVWDYCSSDLFAVTMELATAARSNPELQEMLRPLSRSFNDHMTDAWNIALADRETNGLDTGHSSAFAMNALRGMALQAAYRHNTDMFLQQIDSLVAMFEMIFPKKSNP